MAAIHSCPTCHKEVSADAVTCPHCGQPKPESGALPHGKSRPVLRAFVGLILVAIFVFLVGKTFFSGNDSAPESAVVDVQLGHMYQLHSGYAVCADRKGLDAVSLAIDASDDIGLRHAFERYNCVGSFTFQGRRVRAINIGFDAVKLRLPDGASGWTYTEAIKPVPSNLDSAPNTSSPPPPSSSVMP